MDNIPFFQQQKVIHHDVNFTYIILVGFNSANIESEWTDPKKFQILNKWEYVQITGTRQYINKNPIVNGKKKCQCAI